MFSPWNLYMHSVWMHPARSWNLGHHANLAELYICWEDNLRGRQGYIEGTYIFCKTCMFFEKFTGYIFPRLQKIEEMSHPCTTCRESKLSCIHLLSPVAFWCQTQWCCYCWVEHLELSIHWSLTISSTSKFLSFPTATVGASNTPSAKYMTMETTPNVACWTSTQAGLDDWSETLSNDLCSWHCSGNLPSKL